MTTGNSAQLPRYVLPGNILDEAIASDGSIQKPWGYLLNSFENLGQEELQLREQKSLRILRDDGATYNIYDRQQADKTWKIDLVPWLIDSEEWNAIETGLQERAELFNFILRDLYGERDLIKRGIIPPEVIFGHPAFLRACHGIALSGEHDLINHAADMVRGPDGSMRILADRTQAPSGAGYALENRTVMSRVFPSLFRDSHVHRLANFFHLLRQKLIDLAPSVATPRIVVLTPGAFNETYFEHAYLAEYLGFNLVQSNDLVIRNGFVWMKSLDGLSRVDVILRRVDDYFCDQVELKGDSQLGVPGLLEVARNGNVAIANPLGSGILENPVLLRYLPAISQHVLGRELRLKSVDTWWCGDSDDRDYVLSNFDALIIKPVFRSPGKHSRIVSELNDEERQQLLAAIQREPQKFVAQEKIIPSHIPVFDGSSFSPRPVLLRSYAVASDASYRVMPGGLTRAGLQLDSSMISNQLGAISKDTWILASEPEKQADLWPIPPAETSNNGHTVLPSRVIENMFWLGRYAERAENALRLIRTLFLQVNGAHGLTPTAHARLLQAITRLTATYPGFIEKQANGDTEEELLSVILNKSRVGSVNQCIQALLNCADETKGLLSADNQRIISDIRDEMSLLEVSLRRALLSAPEEALDPMVSSLLALSGIVNQSMIHGTGWRFINIGRQLERALQTINLLRSVLYNDLEGHEEFLIIESLLMTVEGLVSYRRRYQGVYNVQNMLELMLLDSANPRSVVYQLEQINKHISKLPSEENSLEINEEQRYALEAFNLIRLTKLNSLAELGNSGKREALDQLCSRLHFLLSETSNVISNKYFSHAEGPRQLIDQDWGDL